LVHVFLEWCPSLILSAFPLADTIIYHSYLWALFMSSLTNTTGADAIDEAIAQGIDFDGSPIPGEKLALYHQVMGLEAGRQRSGVSNTMRSRIVRIGAKHIPQAELEQMLKEAGFAPLKEKEIAFYYTK
jgi:hypothetical protein